MFTVTLTVILIMGPGKDDLTQSHQMKSLLECFDAALAWDEQTNAAALGAVGFAAGCSVTPTEGRDG